MSKDQELEILKEGLFNDIALSRLTNTLVKLCGIPDGRYSLAYLDAEEDRVEACRFLHAQLVLPKTSPVKYGSSVVGGDVRLVLNISAMRPVSRFVDVSVGSTVGPYEQGHESCYIIDIFLNRAGYQEAV